MSRTLTRPMFRLGGSTSGGITSGLDKPKRGRVDGPGGYSGAKDFYSIFPTKKEMKFTEDILGPRGPDRSVSDFLINYGLNLAGNPPSGNIIQTAAKEAQAPFQKFQAQRGMREQSGRQEKADILGAIMGAKAEMLGGEGAGATYAKERDAQLIRQTMTDLSNHILGEEAYIKEHGQDKFNLEKSILMRNIEKYTGGLNELEGVYKNANAIEMELQGIKKRLINSPKQITFTNETGQEETMAASEYYTTYPDELSKKVKEIYFEEYDNALINALNLTPAEKQATGGRVGYRAGNLVDEQLTEVEETPQGIRAFSENIEEGPASSELSFEELRGRLPPEVTDDIINLIVQSPSALVDFAEVQTQTDVDNFNAKYGVNLVLPSEA